MKIRNLWKSFAKTLRLSHIYHSPDHYGTYSSGSHFAKPIGVY